MYRPTRKDQITARSGRLCPFARELEIPLVGLAIVLLSLCEVIEKKSKEQDTRKDAAIALAACLIFVVMVLGLIKG